MITSRSLALLAAAAFFCSMTAVAADTDTKPGGMKPADMPMDAMSKPMQPGLKVGDAAPAFTLKNAAGTEVSLAGLLAKGKVALVFHRSAEWCPFCIGQLKELQSNLATFAQAGVTVVAISYDSVDTLARAATKHGVSFPLLSDEDSKTIDAFGIRNAEAKGKGMGVPHPSVFVLDGKGVIRAKLMHDGYKTRPTSAEIIAAAKSGM